MQIKAIAKLGLLLSIKESYLLTKNSLGLIWHPIKTLNSLAREKDRSQQLLVIGLPLWVLTAGLALTWLGRRLLATSTVWGVGAITTLTAAIILALALAGYLTYWLLKLKHWYDGR
ncbi:MAG TPA: hypothetical protein VJ242_03800 [Patescibacteria group bacterium]|nr:hypothetical protein [Patescibacteria group bacterium]